MKNKKLLLKILICVSSILIFCSSFFFENQIYNLINKKITTLENQIKNSDYQVHFINVGQADCIALKLPDAKVCLIDCGTSDSSKELVKYLKKYIVKKDNIIEYFIVTHPHADHLGGMKEIFENFEIKELLTPQIFQDTHDGENYAYYNQYLQLIEFAQKENSQLNYIDYKQEPIVGVDYKIEFLSPFDNVKNVNDYSPIILFNLKTKKYVFTGDAEEETEKNILNYYGKEKLKDIDVLKVGHHGSQTSSTTDFIYNLSPEYSIISCGRYNEYGHPHNKVLKVLQAVDTNILRTDNNGNIVLAENDNNQIVVVYQYKNRMPIRIQVWQIVLIMSFTTCTIVILYKPIKFDKFKKIRKK